VKVASIVPSLPRSIVIVATPLATVTTTMDCGRVIVHAPDAGVPSAA
jgi:hypothetical protein